MNPSPDSLAYHRVKTADRSDVVSGCVKWAPLKSLWLLSMTIGAIIGGACTFSWQALLVFLFITAFVLLFGHSLGSHRKFIHDSFQCAQWFEYFLVYCGVQMGLAGPIGLMRQHELRDFAQRLPDCHPYLRHGSKWARDAWWQLNCDLCLDSPPTIRIEPRIECDRFYRFLEATWMWQQLPIAVVLWALGGWAWVFWGTCARVTAGVFGHWLVGFFAHNHGEIHHEVAGAAVQGRNVKMVSLITMGESWHNNHHAFPGSARLGLYPGQWDPGWWTLLTLQKIGLVWRIREPQHLPDRPEVILTNSSTKYVTP
jgi:fatty-acid desaturase